jgi:hypothetical protein
MDVSFLPDPTARKSWLARASSGASFLLLSGFGSTFVSIL